MQMKKFIFEKKNRRTIKNIGRFILIKQDDDDYMTKLDLIDSHMQLFNQHPKFPKLSVDEREKLRVLVIGEDKPFMSRCPNNCNYEELNKLK